MQQINQLIDIIKNNCNYEAVNKVSDKKLRNISNGIQIKDVIYYRLPKYNTKNKI